MAPACTFSTWKPPPASAAMATSLPSASTMRSDRPLTAALFSASTALPVMLPVFGAASRGQSTSMKIGPVVAATGAPGAGDPIGCPAAPGGGGGAHGLEAAGAAGAPGAPGGPAGGGAPGAGTNTWQRPLR